jgi:hypothetical protein
MARKPNPFEGSAKDKAQDKTAAKKAGMSAKAFEKSAADRKLDAKGAAAMKSKGKKGGFSFLR